MVGDKISSVPAHFGLWSCVSQSLFLLAQQWIVVKTEGVFCCCPPFCCCLFFEKWSGTQQEWHACNLCLSTGCPGFSAIFHTDLQSSLVFDLVTCGDPVIKNEPRSRLSPISVFDFMTDCDLPHLEWPFLKKNPNTQKVKKNADFNMTTQNVYKFWG